MITHIEILGLIPLYSVLVTLGVTLGLGVSIWRAPSQQFLYTKIGIGLLFGALLGSRLSYGFQNWYYFKNHLIDLPQVWRGGLSWPGALVGSLAVLILVQLIWKQSFFTMMDVYLPLWAIAAVTIWLASWGAGVGYGPETTAYFGIAVTDSYGQLSSRWPLPIVGAILSIGWGILCLFLPLRRWFRETGQRGLLCLSGLLLFNGVISFMKVNPAPRLWGIRWETYLSWLLFLISTGLVIRIWKDNEMNKLMLNANQAIQTLVEFIQDTVQEAGYTKVVMGVSGGVDSSLSAFLSVKALGPENVLLLRLPYETSSPESLEHAQLVIDQTGAQTATYEITPAVDAVLENFPDAGQVRKGNVMARMRMIHIYDQSASFPGLVVGTGNKTETLLGYSTLYGDGAFDLNPLGDLYKAQVRQLAAAIGVPQSIIDKAPSADLWVGQTDEGELGFTYNEVDRLLYALVEEDSTPEECEKAGFKKEFITEVVQRIKDYRYKSTPPLAGSVGQFPVADVENLPWFYA